VPEVVNYLESKYDAPLLGLTTTGGWGGSAGQYERIKLRRVSRPNENRNLYIRTHPKRTLLNYTLELFSDRIFDLAFEVVKVSDVSAKRYKPYERDGRTRDMLLRAVCGLLGMPRSAICTNAVSHYFGAISSKCEECLSEGVRRSQVPSERTIPVTEALSHWRGATDQQMFEDARAVRLSDLISEKPSAHTGELYTTGVAERGSHAS
jgi:hypothetical protein